MTRLLTLAFLVLVVGCGGEPGDDAQAKPTACRGKNPACQPPAPAPTATVLWNASARATGYRVYYGVVTSGVYESKVDVGNVLSYTLGPFTVGQTVYVIVTAYNKYGESPPSNEASKTL